MDGLIDVIRIINHDDAKLFEGKELHQRKIEIYLKIREMESRRCTICYQNSKKKGNRCGECDAMLFVHELKKKGEMGASPEERREQYKVWRKMYDDPEKRRKGFISHYYQKFMLGAAPASAPAPAPAPASTRGPALISQTGVSPPPIRTTSTARAAAVVAAPTGTANGLTTTVPSKELKKSLKRTSHPSDDDGQTRESKKQKNGTKCKIKRCMINVDGILCEAHGDCKKCIRCHEYRANLKIDGEMCKHCKDAIAGIKLIRKKGMCQAIRCLVKTGSLLCEKHKDAKKCTMCHKYHRYLKIDGKKCERCAKKF
ncbi:MAG: hypothetical protein Harvfovirus2_31 [Harvfovirus sp.]|uniref:Uncharacterized protein n=1 Tax=Harvfovirus sp. TaxID=2487768 RepID=A0A3G5A2T1_9VIRU|nr:MAG: hypothetical protein Harvfovirus2_31 [Harvfovirus sp.]